MTTLHELHSRIEDLLDTRGGDTPPDPYDSATSILDMLIEEGLLADGKGDDEASWTPTESPPEKCEECGGQGWIVIGQNWGNPHGEQIQCDRCGHQEP